jgi:D-threo-aldose 1-dehydrogenase
MPDPAERVPLGQCGLEVTRLGLGCAALGNLYEAMDDAQAEATVDAAWQAGLRLFDTAPLYGFGLSERRLGLALAARPRGEYVLASKVGRRLTPGEPGETIFAEPPSFVPEFDFSYDGVLRGMEESLERLGLSRVDVLHVHDPDKHEEDAIAGAFSALLRLREEGVIGAVGAGMNQSAMLTRFVERGLVDCVLVAGRYTLFEQPALRDLLPAAHAAGVGVIVGGVFNSGLLAAPKSSARYDYAPAAPEQVARAQAIARLCEAHGVALGAAALQLVAAHPAVTSIVVGARSPGEVAECCAWLCEEAPRSLWDDLRSSGILSDEAPTP